MNYFLLNIPQHRWSASFTVTTITAFYCECLLVDHFTCWSVIRKNILTHTHTRYIIIAQAACVCYWRTKKTLFYEYILYHKSLGWIKISPWAATLPDNDLPSLPPRSYEWMLKASATCWVSGEPAGFHLNPTRWHRRRALGITASQKIVLFINVGHIEASVLN